MWKLQKIKALPESAWRIKIYGKGVVSPSKLQYVQTPSCSKHKISVRYVITINVLFYNNQAGSLRLHSSYIVRYQYRFYCHSQAFPATVGCSNVL